MDLYQYLPYTSHITRKNEDDQKEDNLKNEDNHRKRRQPQNADKLKTEDDLKNEGDLKNEDDLKNDEELSSAPACFCFDFISMTTITASLLIVLLEESSPNYMASCRSVLLTS